MDFEERQNLFKVRKTVLEMLEDRKYTIPENEKINFDDFSIKYKNKNLDIFIDDLSENNLKNKLYIHFNNDKSFKKSDLKTLINKVIETYDDDTIKIIILLKEKGNGSILKEINKEIYQNIEIFMNKNMIFNITHHEFVPKHIILNEEEIAELLDKYSTTLNKLPKMLKTDPVSQYYGMKPNQVCKIIRNSPEVGEYISYRIVK
jgi:DNA-directed RNA polymerases I, II, and III subunit RPABC1